MLSTYLVAIASAAFAVISLLTWIFAVNHMDAGADAEKPAAAREHAAV